MNIKSIQIVTDLVFLLIFCYANESLAEKIAPRVAWSAKVDPRAILGDYTEVGAYSIVGANAHLHSRTQITANVTIEEDADLQRKVIILDHGHVERSAKIGSRTICEQYTTVGKGATIRSGSILKQYATVMNGAKIGRLVTIGHYSSIGRNAVLKDSVCVGINVRIGSGATLAKYSIVQDYVEVPRKANVEENQVVIDAPATKVLLRMLQGRKFSKRFMNAVDTLDALSDKEFAQYFSKKIDKLLSNLKKDCSTQKRNISRFVYPLALLNFSYLRRLHGKKLMEILLQPVDVIIVKDGKVKGHIDDCEAERNYEKIFDNETVDKFLVLMAIYYDSKRRTCVESVRFCDNVVSLLTGQRSVLALKSSCGGQIKALCENCANGKKSSRPYSIGESDVMPEP